MTETRLIALYVNKHFIPLYYTQSTLELYALVHTPFFIFIPDAPVSKIL